MIIERYTKNIDETSLSIAQTHVNAIKKKNIAKTGIRVYKDGLIGVAGAIGAYDEDKLLEQAEEALDNKVAYKAEASSNIQQEMTCESKLPDKASIIAEVESMLGNVRSENANYSLTGNINLTYEQQALVNDNKLELRYNDRYASTLIFFKESSSINMCDGWIQAKGREFSGKALGGYIHNILNAYSKKVELPKEGRYPVIFSTNELLPVSKLLSELNGKKIATGSSLFSGKIDQKIFSSSFSLFQSRNPKDLICPFFDAEGIINKDYRYPLIKDGVIAAPYTDKRLAAQYNLPITGAAVGEYDEAPGIGYVLEQYIIGDSRKSLKELLGGDVGIFILTAIGGNFTEEGNFATPVHVAFLYDGEHFLGRLPKISISSNIFEMYGEDYRGVSTDSINPVSLDKHMVIEMNINKL